MNKQLFVTGSVTQNSAYDTNRKDLGDLEGIGTLRWVGDKLYRWCQNTDSAEALAVGDAVFHRFTDGANALKYVNHGETIDLGFMAGIVASTTIHIAATANTPDGGYGWVQVLGYNAALKVQDSTATIVAGTWLVGAASELHLHTSAGVMGTAPIYARGVMLMTAVAAVTATTVTSVQTSQVGFVSCL